MAQHPIPATSRRMFLKGIGGVGLAAVLAACSKAPSTGGGGQTAAAPSDVSAKWPTITSKEVVVAGFGGETYDVRHKLLFDEFTKVSGAKVVDAPWDYGKFLTMVDGSNPPWDMIDFDGYSTVSLVEAGTPPAKLAEWVRRCDLVDPKYQDYAAGSYAYSVVQGWSSKLDGTPKDWSDFFDTKKFPGKRAFPKSIYAGTAEIALMADGVSKDKLYPLDFDRAFAKLNTIKDDLIFYDSYAQGQQYIVQGSASLIATANSRMIQLQKGGQGDFTYQDAVLYPWGAFPITEHAQHADAANALVDYMSTEQSQATVASSLYLGPTVSSAFDRLSDADLKKMPNSDENKALAAVLDTEVAARQDADYVKRFFSWVGQ